jgi:hypothetical protein
VVAHLIQEPGAHKGRPLQSSGIIPHQPVIAQP